MMTLLNAINCRKVHGEANVFQAMRKHTLFPFGLLAALVVQVLLVELGGEAVAGGGVKDSGLSLAGWLLCIVLGFSTLVWGLVLRLIPTGVFKHCCCAHMERNAVQPFDCEAAAQRRKRNSRWYQCHKKGHGKRLSVAFERLHHFKSTRTERVKALTLSVARERVANLN
jgi:hypothetical protein